MTAPSIAPADAELSRLETAVTAIAANLVELDNNPARQELDRTKLTGRTARQWAAATEALAQLWDHYRLLTELITRARALRDQRKLGDADRAVFVREVLGTSITLSVTTVPLAQRGLLGAGQVSTTCTPAELLAAMEAAFATAVGVASRAGEAWQRLLPAAAEAATAVEHVRALTRAAGLPTTTIDDADRRLTAFMSRLATDPLTADDQELSSVRAVVARADAERTSAAELRDSLTQRLADARRLSAELETCQQAADAAARAAADRFRPQDVRTVRGPDLGPDLAAVEALAAAGQWALISPRLADWTRRARERAEVLRDAAARNAGLLTARNELRGRLGAYHAKAAHHGLGEDTMLTSLFEAARAALWAAPCDLEAGRAAVAAYQDSLTATIARNGG